MNRLSVLLYFFLPVFYLSFSACTRVEQIQEIVPGIVMVDPEIQATDSLIFSELKLYPEIKITKMFHCSYLKPVAASMDSAQYLREFLLQLPFMNYLHSAFLVTIETQTYQSFICHLANMDTLYQNRWMSILDSMGYQNSRDTSYYRKIQLTVPVNQELAYSSKLLALSSVRNANPLLIVREKVKTPFGL